MFYVGCSCGGCDLGILNLLLRTYNCQNVVAELCYVNPELFGWTVFMQVEVVEVVIEKY